MNNRKALPSLVILTIWLGWICLYSATMILTPLLPIIETEFKLPHVLAGLLVSAYMLPYSLMQILSGYLSDRSGTRKPFFYPSCLWRIYFNDANMVSERSLYNIGAAFYCRVIRRNVLCSQHSLRDSVIR